MVERRTGFGRYSLVAKENLPEPLQRSAATPQSTPPQPPLTFARLTAAPEVRSSPAAYAGASAVEGALRWRIRTASMRFSRTDSTRIEKPLAAIVSPRLGSRPSSANTNPPTEL